MGTIGIAKALGITALAITVLAGQATAANAAEGKDRPEAPGRGAKITTKDKAPAAKGKQVPGEYLVMVEDGHAPKGIAKEVGASPKFVYSAAVNGFAAKLTDKQVEKLSRHPHVVVVEPNMEIEGDATQTIPASGQPWGIDRIDARSGRDLRYTYWGNGAGVTAYILDSGIDTTHADFGGRAKNLWDGIGDGMQGKDCHGHGTHVAGTVGGTKYGIAKKVQLRGIRILDCNNRGNFAVWIAAVDWVRANAIRPAVANMSVGGPKSTMMNAAVTNLINSGVFVAVAAGNDNQNACSYSPASAAGTMTVASIDYTDTKASDSNWGGCVDLYAPGAGIASTRLGGGELIMSGTSMATPHVTGIAALIKGDYGEVTSPDMITYIKSYTTVNAVRGNVTGTPNRLLFQAGW